MVSQRDQINSILATRPSFQTTAAEKMEPAPAPAPAPLPQEKELWSLSYLAAMEDRDYYFRTTRRSVHKFLSLHLKDADLFYLDKRDMKTAAVLLAMADYYSAEDPMDFCEIGDGQINKTLRSEKRMKEHICLFSAFSVFHSLGPFRNSL